MFVETMLSVVMYVFRVSVSLFWGYPKSMTSMAQGCCSTEERGVSRVEDRLTINKLIYQHEVVLHSLLVDLAEIRLGY